MAATGSPLSLQRGMRTLAIKEHKADVIINQITNADASILEDAFNEWSINNEDIFADSGDTDDGTFDYIHDTKIEEIMAIYDQKMMNRFG